MFMEPQITEKQTWIRFDISETGQQRVVPAEHRDIAESEGTNLQEFDGYGARFSAPGYTDATEWSVHDSLVGAAEHLFRRTSFTDEEKRDEIMNTISFILKPSAFGVVPGMFKPDLEVDQKTKTETYAVVRTVERNGKTEKRVKNIRTEESEAYLDALERAEKIAPEHGGIEK